MQRHVTYNYLSEYWTCRSTKNSIAAYTGDPRFSVIQVYNQ